MTPTVIGWVLALAVGIGGLILGTRLDGIRRLGVVAAALLAAVVVGWISWFIGTSA